MKNETHEDAFIDRISDEIARESLPDSAVSETTARVWQKISAEAAGEDHVLSCCADYQTLIPKILDGSLSEARALLVNDHMGECVSCRRALMDARSDHAHAIPQRRPGHPSLRRFFAVAALAIFGIASAFLSYRALDNHLINHHLRASVQEIDGGLQMIGPDKICLLSAGAEISADQALRTSKNSGAIVRLADGSTIEMDERSEMHLHASRRGTTIKLARGNIIVHAAKQKKGHLYVDTGECEVAVKGTVFTVAHGLKGSRVSVFEGKVEVKQGGTTEALLPGQQLNTNSRLAPVPLVDEISWSHNAEQRRALLAELGVLNREMAKATDVITKRSSTRLLDLAPPDTLIYAGMPNVAESIAEARSIFDARLAQSPVLSQWWESHVVAEGIDDEIEDVLNRVQSLGEAVGEEIVVAIPQSAIQHEGGALVLAELENPADFESRLAAEVEQLNTASEAPRTLVIIDDPSSGAVSGEHVYLWVHNDVFAAALEIETLQALAERMNSSSTFSGTELYAGLSDAYSSGVEWIFGMDLHDIVASATSDLPDDAEILNQLGLLDAGTLIIEHSSEDERSQTSASLDFDGPRHGMAAWLAAPAPMGSLDFVSAQASVAGAVVSEDAADMFDDFLNILASVQPEMVDGLRDFESNYAVNLRSDLAETLGGEAAFALDGPILPTPSWKFIVEVYDPGALNHTIENAIEEINRMLESEDKDERLALNTATVGGHQYFSIGREGMTPVLSYTIVDGFLIAGPNPALIDHAIQIRDSGATLPNSQAFRDLLPTNGYTNCSALSYLNLSGLADVLSGSGIGGMSPEAADLLRQTGTPSLLCVYGEVDRILVESIGTSPLGPAPLMGLSNLIRDMEHSNSEGAATEVSS